MITIGLNYLLPFILPASTCLFLITGPHSIVGTLAWTLPFWLILLVDWLNPHIRQKSSQNLSPLFHDSILFGLSILQFANIALMLDLISLLRWETGNDIVTSLANLVALRFLVGTSSGTSGIVVAHELIHRPEQKWQWLGRLLLISVCYEHFIIAHKRGHHLSLSMPEDIATARLGENFKDYWHRVYVGYLRYAWQSEQGRLAQEANQNSLVPVILQNQVAQGLLIEFALLLLIISSYGWLAGLMFLYQAYAAIRILEAVNYFQHWGLEQGQFGNTFGWVSQSELSRYALIGLTNHIGHHENENKHYYEIAYSNKGPKLPYGYFVMNLWVKLNNASYQKMALQELENFRSLQQ